MAVTAVRSRTSIGVAVRGKKIKNKGAVLVWTLQALVLITMYF